MITADPTPVFPACPTFGFVTEPNYLVKIVAREGGFERRNRKWSRPLHKYSAVPLGTQAQSDIEAVLYFWHAVGGMATPFRFKDWADFMSCGLDHTPGPTDQPIVAVPNSPSTFQLVKRYTFGSLSQDREITRPVGSTIRIANGAGVEQSPSHWTLDESTGELFVDGGFTGTPTHWGGEFHVPVRFDGQLAVQLIDYKAQQLTVALAEIRVVP